MQQRTDNSSVSNEKLRKKILSVLVVRHDDDNDDILDE